MSARLFRFGCQVVVVCWLSTAAVAADPEGHFAVRGVGLESCGNYVGPRTEQPALRAVTRSWFNGYLSAYNQLVPDTYDVTKGASLEELEVRLVKHCQTNPEHSIAFAAIAVASALDSGRVRANPGLSADKPVVGADLWRRIQKALKSRGHYKGSVDGIDGPVSRAGIESFQRAEGLPVTRHPDALTLARLLQ